MNNKGEGKRCKRNWADLHADLLVSIAERLQFIQDYVVFRSVCASWRSAAAKENFKHRLPLLLKERQILSFNNGKFEETATLFPAAGRIKTLCLGTKGWILVVTESGSMYLQHVLRPDSRILLPSKNKLQRQKHGRVYIQKAALSSSPRRMNSTGGGYTLVLTFETYHATLGYQLAFWRSGDETYTKINTNEMFAYGVYDLLFGRDGALCFAVTNTEVFSIDFTSQNPSATHTRVALMPPTYGSGRWLLVESEGELLVILRTCHLHESRATVEFSVLRLSESGEWQEINDLGNRALFVAVVGGNASFSLDNASAIPGCMPNHIYFTGHDNVLPIFTGDVPRIPSLIFPHRMGIFNLENRTTNYLCCSQYKQVCTFSRAPLWVQTADFSSW